MTTRRSRIKGVLNIPARRKTDDPPKHDDLVKDDTLHTNNSKTKDIDDGIYTVKKNANTETHNKDKGRQEVPSDTECVRTVSSNLQSLKPIPCDSIVSGIKKLPTNSDNMRLDIEPPPSPTKMNRTRIKAVPRLGQHRVSFSVGSASESEDDSRRQSSRHRNDSVCSNADDSRQQQQSTPIGRHQTADINGPVASTTTASGTVLTTSPLKKEFNCMIQRKCRRTEQARKLAAAKRDFFHKFRGNTPPDRHRLTMMDLIFYNPTTNPMATDVTKETPTPDEKNVFSDGENEDDPGKKSEEDMDDPDDQDGSIAPQVTVNADGEIIIDEKSLLIENKKTVTGRQKMERAHLVNGDENTGYGIYKRVKRTKDWSKTETLRFYKALNTIGTDFTLMVKLFPNRTRRELKMKFKKEERINHVLIDKAVLEPVQFDMKDLEADLEKELIKEKELELRKKEILAVKCNNKKIRLKRPPHIQSREDIINNAIENTVPDSNPKQKILNSVFEVLDESDDENNTESEVEEENSKDCDDYVPPPQHNLPPLPAGMKRPKRNLNSRHIYKKTKLMHVDPFTINSEDNDHNSSINDLNSSINDLEDEALEPGSLIIEKNSEKNSTEPEYKIFMITADRKKVAIDLSSDIVKNLATSAGSGVISENHDIVLGIENNYTIDEESQENVTVNEEPVVVPSESSEPEHIQTGGDILILPLD